MPSSPSVQAMVAEFNLYFTSANGIDVGERVSVPRDEWRALHDCLRARLHAGRGLDVGQIEMLIDSRLERSHDLANHMEVDLDGPERERLRLHLGISNALLSLHLRSRTSDPIPGAAAGGHREITALELDQRFEHWAARAAPFMLDEEAMTTEGASLAKSCAKLAFAEGLGHRPNTYLPPPPCSAQEIREFLGSDFERLQFGREDQTPDDDDRYTLTAHDLLSAFSWWKECRIESPRPPERETFEAWADREGYPLTPETAADESYQEPAGYSDPRTHAAWRAWQGRPWAEPQLCGDEGLTALARIRDDLMRRFPGLPSADEAIGRPDAVFDLVLEALDRAPGHAASLAAIHHLLKAGAPIDAAALKTLIEECERSVPALAEISQGRVKGKSVPPV